VQFGKQAAKGDMDAPIITFASGFETVGFALWVDGVRQVVQHLFVFRFQVVEAGKVVFLPALLHLSLQVSEEFQAVSQGFFVDHVVSVVRFGAADILIFTVHDGKFQFVAVVFQVFGMTQDSGMKGLVGVSQDSFQEPERRAAAEPGTRPAQDLVG